jgi:hypothetical protein
VAIDRLPPIAIGIIIGGARRPPAIAIMVMPLPPIVAMGMAEDAGDGRHGGHAGDHHEDRHVTFRMTSSSGSSRATAPSGDRRFAAPVLPRGRSAGVPRPTNSQGGPNGGPKAACRGVGVGKAFSAVAALPLAGRNRGVQQGRAGRPARNCRGRPHSGQPGSWTLIPVEQD